jgi:hypothetical protein
MRVDFLRRGGDKWRLDEKRVPLLMCRMYACVRALIFGDDFTTDPVSQGLGFALRYFSGGAIALNVPLVSQVRARKTDKKYFWCIPTLFKI